MILLLLTIVFTSFSYGSIDSDHGKEDGETVGKFIGELFGKNDYNDGKDNDWQEAIPSQKEIIKLFNLSRETYTYRNAFITYFRKYFEEGYKEAFRESNVTLATEEADNTGLIDGLAIGEIMGQLKGTEDFEKGLNSSWRRVLPSDEEIIETYNLYREVPSYKGGFLEGFKKAFETHYIMGFRNANLNEILKNINVVDEIEYTNITTFGGSISSDDKVMTITFDKGGLYKDNYIAIETSELKVLDPIFQLTPTTELYEVKLQEATIFPQKPFRLSFKYFGPESGGIYALKDGDWIYLSSKIEGEDIYTMIEEPLYKGGKYAVFISGSYKELEDIEDHWANVELDYFNRNNLLRAEEGKYYKPDNPMTRGEFILLLDKYYKWPTINNVNLSKYKDSVILEDYENSFGKGVALGYISGYSDDTLRPHMPISYQEVEWIMQKILNNKGFKWETVAEKLEEEKGFSSLGLLNNRLFVTKAEIIYLLYSLK